MPVAKMEPHRPRLGDLQHLVEIAPCAGEVALGAPQASAGERAAGEINRDVRAAQLCDGDVEMFAGGDEMRRGVAGGRRGQRQAERGAAEAEIVQADGENPILTLGNGERIGAALGDLFEAPFPEQQIAELRAYERIEARNLGLQLLLSRLGVCERRARPRDVAGNGERMGVMATADKHLTLVRAFIGEVHAARGIVDRRRDVAERPCGLGEVCGDFRRVLPVLCRDTHFQSGSLRVARFAQAAESTEERRRVAENPGSVLRLQSCVRRLKRLVEKPGERREAGADRSETVLRMEVEFAVRPASADAVLINFCERLLLTPGLTAMRNGLEQRLQRGDALGRVGPPRSHRANARRACHAPPRSRLRSRA